MVRRSPRSSVRRALRRGTGASVVVALLAGVAGIVAASPAAAQAPVFTFTGGGYGHGVGMSQYGAKGRADAGQTAAQIIGAYYPGTAIEGRSLPGPRVKLGTTSSTEVWSPGGPVVGTPHGGVPTNLVGPGERLSVRMFGTAVIAQRVSPDTGPIVVLSTNGGRYSLQAADGQELAVSATGRSYSRGVIALLPAASSFEMILSGISMQQYLYGLGEVPPSWPAEALRAQAVLGRTVAAYRLAHPADADYDLQASTADQAYIGTSQTAGPSGGNWVAAVDATDGQVVTWGGQPIQTFYSSSNGGHSERTDYVFVANLPYYTAAPDPFDATPSNPNASWTRTFGGDEIAYWLVAAGRPNVGVVTGISIGGNVGGSGRVDKATVTVTGTTGSTTLTGNQLRSAINAGAPSSRDLRSTRFSVSGGAPPPPADTTAPNLLMLMGRPMQYGANGNICSFLASDEVAITAIHVRIRGVDLRSAARGVGPTFPQLVCINIPRRLRPARPIAATLTGAALDAAGNMRFTQQPVTIQR